MPHVLRTLPDHPIVELIPRGALQDPEVLQMLTDALAMQRDLDIPDALVDCTDVTHGLPYHEIINLVDYLTQQGVPSQWRHAIVKPRDLNAAVAMQLWEAACGNRGITARVFVDRESALAWLDSRGSAAQA